MHSLDELQQHTFRAIATGHNEYLAPYLVGGKIPAATRIRVYANNLRETARKALAAGYPVVERLVGEACFRNLARVYVAQHPSVSGDLTRFGARFSRFLAEFYRDTEFDYLSSVAEIEWACVECAISVDAPTLDIDALAGIPESGLPGLRFELHPAVRTLSVRHGAFTIWRAHQDEDFARVELRAPEQAVLVYRSGGRVVVQPIAPASSRFLEVLRAGVPLLEAQDAAAQIVAEFDPAAVLHQLFTEGLLIGISR